MLIWLRPSRPWLRLLRICVGGSKGGAWARAGHDVTVVTCVPNCPDGVVYAGYRNRVRRQVEEVDGVRVVRVWTYVAPNAGTLRRIANYVSYQASATWTSLRLPRPDVIVATSPQFFCGWAGVWASRIKRVPLVLEIRDIWPESIAAVGAMRPGIGIRYLEWLERRMYLAARQIVTVGTGYPRAREWNLACRTRKRSLRRELVGIRSLHLSTKHSLPEVRRTQAVGGQGAESR
jgi:Glycosyl transferase 4-like domain